MIAVNNKNKTKKDANENFVYFEYTLKTEHLIKLLKLTPKNVKNRDHLSKFVKDNSWEKNIIEFDVNNEQKCYEFFEEVAKRIRDNKISKNEEINEG